MKLHPAFTLPVLPDETPVSYASRVASRLNRSLRSLLVQLSISFQGIVDGDDACVLALAGTTGQDVRAFARSTLKRIDGTTFSLGAERLRRDAVNRRGVSVCRECIVEDLKGPLGAHGRYGRWYWQLASYRCCHIHNSVLLGTAGAASVQRDHDFAWHLDLGLPGLLASPSETVEAEAARLPEYIVRRVHGTAPGSWLSSIPLDAAVKTMEMVGITIRAGVQTNWKTVEGIDWLRAGSDGYLRLREGPEGLVEFLTELRASASPTEFGLRKIYGTFYDYLDRHAGEGFEVVRDIMREHILATTAVGADEVILGEPVTKRRLHSVRSASVEFGLHPKTLRKNLTDLGIIENISPTELPHDRALFDAAAHTPLLHQLAEAMPRAEAQRYLGLSRSLAHFLNPPYVQPVDHTRFGRFENLFTRTELERFAARVTANATAPLPTDCNLLPIGHVPPKVQKALSDIFVLVVEGRLQTVRWNGRLDGIGSLLVDPDEVRGLLVEESDYMTVAEIKAALSCSRAAVAGLLQLNALPHVSHINPLNHRSARLVSRDAVARFAATYVSVHNLARAIGRHGKWLRQRLTDADIPPDIPANVVPSGFYLRSKVPEILATI
jgi:hypothetical protein